MNECKNLLLNPNSNLNIITVDSLPNIGEEGVLYALKKTFPIEYYLYINGVYEKMITPSENQNKIKFEVKKGKNLDIQEIKIYNQSGKEIFRYNKSRNIYKWSYYNSDNMLIHERNQYVGGEWWYKYDEKGNLIYKMNPEGGHVKYEYNEKNYLVCKLESDGREHWYEYDEKGKLIFSKNFNCPGLDWNLYEYKYDERGNMISEKNVMSDHSIETIYKYNEKNYLVHKKNYIAEWWYKYDERGNLIQSESDKGYILTKKYDKNNNCIFKRSFNDSVTVYDSINIVEEIWKYDENNNEIHYENSHGEEYNINIFYIEFSVSGIELEQKIRFKIHDMLYGSLLY